MLVQQQQAAALQQQQQQQQQQLLQQQMLGGGLPGMANPMPGLAGGESTKLKMSLVMLIEPTHTVSHSYSKNNTSWDIDIWNTVISSDEKCILNQKVLWFNQLIRFPAA